jgi:DNA-binding transcriptional LysR family regulator
MTEPIRLGYHGSSGLVWDIVDRTGYRRDEFALSEYPVADPFGPLRRGEQDAIVVKFGLDEEDLAGSAVLGTDPRAAVLGKDHPLADRESISIEELAGVDSFQAPGDMPDYVWDQVVPPHTPAGRPIHRVHTWSTVPELIKLVADAGAVHFSLLSIAEVAPPAVRIVPIHDLPPAPVLLGWLRERSPKRVLDFVGVCEGWPRVPER